LVDCANEDWLLCHSVKQKVCQFTLANFVCDMTEVELTVTSIKAKYASSASGNLSYEERLHFKAEGRPM